MVARGSFGLMLLQGNLQRRSCRQRPRWTKRRSTLSRKRSSSKRMIRLRLAVPTNVIETAGEGIEGRVEGRNVVLAEFASSPRSCSARKGDLSAGPRSQGLPSSLSRSTESSPLIWYWPMSSVLE